MRESPLFMRNSLEVSGKYGIPMLHKEMVVEPNIQLVACSDTRAHDREENLHKGVHFFVDDYRFQGIYNNPKKSLNRYAQYDFLLSPDFSLYADMPLWKQIESVAKNRWVGAFWQSEGLKVIPTISWSTARSFEFCFDGVEAGASVAVGMIGCKKTGWVLCEDTQLCLINSSRPRLLYLVLRFLRWKVISSLLITVHPERWCADMGGRGTFAAGNPVALVNKNWTLNLLFR